MRLKVIDLSLTNDTLYHDCEIETVGGRLNLVTPPGIAKEIIGRNADNLEVDYDQVTLTGPMAVWCYMIVFHVIGHKTRKVVYDDGRGNVLEICAHG